MKRATTQELERIGLVGLGLMGRGIATCFLGHGFEVVAFNRTASRARKARVAIGEHLREAVRRKVFRRAQVADLERRFKTVRSVAELSACSFVIESVKENLVLKRQLYDELESSLAPNAVIASNTSSFPLTLLQKGWRHPDRMIVMHWAEPAWITRFLEVVRNERTSDETIRRTRAVARACDKQPSILNFDIRGFIANRLMYAFIREACYMADIGVADFATIDQSFRNDTGWWSALAGPFRWMDLTGIQAYGLVMDDLLPELCNSGKLPAVMKKMRAQAAQGIANRKGFYRYNRSTAKAWEKAWVDFTFEIRNLVRKYEARLRKAGAIEA
jgi:3-hydroxybutyryl-CoA dehydrogenase